MEDNQQSTNRTEAPSDKGMPPPLPFPARRNLLDPRLRATLVFVLLNVAAFVASASMAARPDDARGAFQRLMGVGLEPTLARLGACAPYLIEIGEYWRLGASLFLHNGLFHLVIVMMGLFYLSYWLEPVLKPWRFVTLYIVSGVAGNLFAYGVNALLLLGGVEEGADVVSTGASAAVFGLLGAMIAGEWVARGSLSGFFQSAQGRRIFWFAVLALAFSVLFPVVDWWAHVGGLLSGLAIGLFFFSHLRVKPLPAMRSLGHNALGALVAFCVFAGFATTRPVKTGDELSERIVVRMSELYGMKREALKWVDVKIAASGEDFFWRFQQANLLLATRQYEKARETTAALLEQKPDDPLTLRLDGLAAWRLGDLDRAVERFETVERRILGDDDETTGSPRPAADRDLVGVATIATLERALVLRQMGKEDESLDVARELAGRLEGAIDEITSRVARLEEVVADWSFFDMKMEERLAYGREQLILAVRKNDLAWVRAEYGFELEQGLKSIQEAIEVLPRPAFIDTRGWLYYRMGQFRRAEEDFLQALSDNGVPSAELLYHLAAARAKMGQKEQARKDIRRALELGHDFDAIERAKRLARELGGVETDGGS